MEKKKPLSFSAAALFILAVTLEGPAIVKCLLWSVCAVSTVISIVAYEKERKQNGASANKKLSS